MHCTAEQIAANRSGLWQLERFVLLIMALVAVTSIPHDVAIAAHVEQRTDGVHVLVRVPLEAIRDIELPLYGPGYLRYGSDLDEALVDAAELWIAGGLSVSAAAGACRSSHR